MKYIIIGVGLLIYLAASYRVARWVMGEQPVFEESE